MPKLSIWHFLVAEVMMSRSPLPDAAAPPRRSPAAPHSRRAAFGHAAVMKREGTFIYWPGDTLTALCYYCSIAPVSSVVALLWRRYRGGSVTAAAALRRYCLRSQKVRSCESESPKYLSIRLYYFWPVEFCLSQFCYKKGKKALTKDAQPFF